MMEINGREIEKAQEAMDTFMGVLGGFVNLTVDEVGQEALGRIMMTVGECINNAIEKETGRKPITAGIPAGVSAALLGFMMLSANGGRSRINVAETVSSMTIN